MIKAVRMGCIIIIECWNLVNFYIVLEWGPLCYRMSKCGAFILVWKWGPFYLEGVKSGCIVLQDVGDTLYYRKGWCIMLQDVGMWCILYYSVEMGSIIFRKC